jgi:Reverse transcriptase (RNA-dependent DNA polymerase)
MANAEEAGNLAVEQYGSRKGKSSIAHATNKQLTFDIININKQDTALMVLDAKSCYDRISPPIASLCLQRQGAPQSFCDLLFTTIDQMSHFIRTSYGDSESCYRREDIRFHGVLQGNGAGPAIWATVSSPLLDRLSDSEFGVQITSPATGQLMRIPAFAFVDDTDLIQDTTNSSHVNTRPQEVLELWEESLRTTGGALVGDKCSWFSISHRWKYNCWSYCDNTEKPGDLFLPDSDGNRIRLTRHNPLDAVQALGVFFSPGGSMKQQVEYMKIKAD